MITSRTTGLRLPEVHKALVIGAAVDLDRHFVDFASKLAGRPGVGLSNPPPTNSILPKLVSMLIGADRKSLLVRGAPGLVNKSPMGWAS